MNQVPQRQTPADINARSRTYPAPSLFPENGSRSEFSITLMSMATLAKKSSRPLSGQKPHLRTATPYMSCYAQPGHAPQYQVVLPIAAPALGLWDPLGKRGARAELLQRSKAAPHECASIRPDRRVPRPQSPHLC